MSIHNNLRQLRLASGMTQEQVAEKLGVTRQAVSSYEGGRTRPDIDMLLRLCQVYGTDLDGILYGETRALKGAKRLKTAALAFPIVLMTLLLASASLPWAANHFFVIPGGPMTAEKRALFTVRQNLLAPRAALDQLALTAALFGPLLLLALLLAGQCAVPLKRKLLYAAALAGGVLLVSAPFALTDPVYGLGDYMITPIRVIIRLLFFLAVFLVVECVQRRRKKIRQSQL